MHPYRLLNAAKKAISAWLCLRAIWLRGLLAALLVLGLAPAAQAANCSIATSQGTTGPAAWQSYCWIDFSSYNDTTARSSSGQNFSLTLQDGTVVAFNMKVTTPAALTPIATPSWSGASIGNSSFLGISGSPVLYQTGAGTSVVTISGITLTPPTGASTVTSYMFVAADGESTNDGESLQFQTNGANWVQLDQSGPISGSLYPTTSGLGSNTFTETGVAGTVGAYIVGSSTPTTITTTMVGGGLQGAMFAIRFASIKLNMQITGARAAAADQFNFTIAATPTSATLATGASSGTGLGPFTSAAVSSSSAIPLTLSESMAGGSTNSLSHYRTLLTCTNSASGSSTVLPTAVATASYSFGTMQFGDNISCTFTTTPYPHLTLIKKMGSSGRQFTGDQFVMSVAQGATVLATTTTTGSGSTVNNGTTAQAQVSAATTYTFGEAGAGATSLTQYTAAMACTNAASGSATTLPSGAARTITPAMGDIVTCTITNTKIASNALLTVLKSSTVVSDPVNGASNPKIIPGAILLYTFTVANTGPSTPDSNSVWLVDALPAQLSVGTGASPSFTQGSPTSGLTFTASTDIKYSNSSTAPTSFAACTYSPVATYDPAVKFVCLNPKGTMAGSTGTAPSFTLSIKAQVN